MPLNTTHWSWLSVSGVSCSFFPMFLHLMHFFSPLLIWWERVMCRNSGAADLKWLAFIFKFHPKSGLFLICILFWIRACLSPHFSVGPCAPADSIWSLELGVGGWGGSQKEMFSEWEGVTAGKHLSGSLPPLLFKSRHAFAHKGTCRHMGMCCETFSGDIRRGNAAAAGNQHTNTHQHTHRCLQDIWGSPLLLSPLLWLSLYEFFLARLLHAVQSGESKAKTVYSLHYICAASLLWSP